MGFFTENIEASTMMVKYQYTLSPIMEKTTGNINSGTIMVKYLNILSIRMDMNMVNVNAGIATGIQKKFVQ